MSDVLAELLADVKTEPITSPRFKAKGLCIRTISGAERSQILAVLAKDTTPDKHFTYVEAVLVSVGDDKGARKFPDERRDDVRNLPAAELQDIAEQAMTFNGLSRGAVDEAKKN